MHDKRDDWAWSGVWGKKTKWVNIDRITLIKLGFLAGLGILLLMVGNLIKLSPAEKGPADIGREVHPSGTAVPVVGNNYQMALETQLASTLAQIKGAGEVVVQVSLEGGSSISYATNSQQEVRTSEEKDPTGVTRTSQETRNEAQVVMAREGGSERPVIAGETLPVVRGVLVVATGAQDPSIKERLAQAVQVLLGLPAHKVMVLEREER